MKKLIPILVVLLSAGVLLWFLDYQSSKPTYKQNKYSNNALQSKVVIDFKAFCDSMRNENWNPMAFKERQDRLNVYKSKQLVSTTEYISLEEYMYSAYSNSLNNEFLDWKNNCDESNLQSLYNEILRISKINKVCNSKLQETTKLIEQYYVLIGIPNRVKKIIQREYNENNYQGLYNHVGSLPNSIGKCSNVSSVKSEAIKALDNYKSFIKNFNETMKNINNGSVYTYEDDLSSLCYQARLGLYNYYINRLEILDVCR